MVRDYLATVHDLSDDEKATRRARPTRGTPGIRLPADQAMREGPFDATIWLPYGYSNQAVAIRRCVMGFPDRIERSINLAHPPTKVWQALTTAEQEPSFPATSQASH